MPDLAGIAATSGLAPRRLRYVLDHRLLPGATTASRGRGAPRHFTPFEAFGLILAAVMLEAGLKRALVRDCLAALCPTPSGEILAVPLFRAFAATDPARLEVGDWSHVRLVVADSRPRPSFDTGWLPLGGGPPAAGSFAPLVTLGLDVGQLRGRGGPRA